MPNIKANGIQIEYDTFGEKSSPALLMVMGLATQMIGWEKEFCQQLADKGHYVIRFDNRDIGLSTKVEGLNGLSILQITADLASGKKIDIPYSLEDMADDAVGLLNALDIDKAHICGASMGGMIAQIIACRYPSKVLSLISIMSTTGDPNIPPATLEAMTVLLTPSPSGREAYIDHSVATWKTLGSPGFPFDEDRVRQNAVKAFDRSFYPSGVVRQTLAVMTQTDRTSALGAIKVPTMIIHGADDILVPVDAGKASAAAIPGAELFIIEGMGHDLPIEVWDPIIDAITRNTNKVKLEKEASPVMI